MNQDDRAPFDAALQRAREAAYPPGEYVEQESFMRADEIRALALRAGVGSGVSVLDVCCGIAGPGRFLARELGCAYLGVDASAGAIDIARARAEGLDCRFAVARVPPLPDGEFDVVLLLETMLAFRDKGALLGEIAGAVAAGGRFAFTLEAGAPLTEPERARMPDADTVWLTPFEEMQALLQQAGLIAINQGGATRVRDWRHHGGLELLLEGDVPEALNAARAAMEMRACIGVPPSMRALRAVSRSTTMIAPNLLRER